MPDWTAVKKAREEADEARLVAERWGRTARVTGGGNTLSPGTARSEEARATMLAADALCKELRALGVLIEQVSGDA